MRAATPLVAKLADALGSNPGPERGVSSTLTKGTEISRGLRLPGTSSHMRFYNLSPLSTSPRQGGLLHVGRVTKLFTIMAAILEVSDERNTHDTQTTTLQ